jgi:hypothetical protein
VPLEGKTVLPLISTVAFGSSATAGVLAVAKTAQMRANRTQPIFDLLFYEMILHYPILIGYVKIGQQAKTSFHHFAG